MLKTRATAEQIINEVINFLSDYIAIDKVVLYGSYAYGNPREDSDFDIAVISDDFGRMDILRRIELFSRVALAIDSRVELKGFTKNEFFNPEKGSLLELIKNHGKIIFNL